MDHCLKRVRHADMAIHLSGVDRIGMDDQMGIGGFTWREATLPGIPSRDHHLRQPLRQTPTNAYAVVIQRMPTGDSQVRAAPHYLLIHEPGRKGRPRGGTGWIYRYDPKWTWKRLSAAIVKASGKAITMYGMRHSFASNFLIAGVSDVKVARWLGHTDTRMVHRHYGHLLSYDDDINALGRMRDR